LDSQLKSPIGKAQNVTPKQAQNIAEMANIRLNEDDEN